MLLLSAAAVALTLALGFTVVASRVVTAASRADADAAARQRFAVALQGAAPAGEPPHADVAGTLFDTLSARLGPTAAEDALRPGARLREDLGLGPADVEDVTLLVAARCELRIPVARDLDALHGEVATVEDLVRYVARFAHPAVERAA